jgi:DNA helicase-2/ATP-dependent DNA helicase PcrA
MRFLTLWQGVGDVTANSLIHRIMLAENLDKCLDLMSAESKLPDTAPSTVDIVRDLQNDVPKALSKAYGAMEEVLAAKYKNQEWDKRRNDFSVVEKLAEKHSSIFEFIEAYVLDPLYVTARSVASEDNDVVTVITIHSAKGMEREVCYVLNVSPQAYPLSYVVGNPDKVEEERRVLYVALTRAKDELIVTRHCSSANGGYASWARADRSHEEEKPETYFLNSLPENLFVENVHQQSSPFFGVDSYAPEARNKIQVGIKID